MTQNLIFTDPDTNYYPLINDLWPSCLYSCSYKVLHTNVGPVTWHGLQTDDFKLVFIFQKEYLLENSENNCFKKSWYNQKLLEDTILIQ